MNCVNHSDTAAVAYCRTCGKALCNACSRNVGGVVYCESCVAERMQGMPARPPQGSVIPPQTRPIVAGLLGFIPGVGAMYNGQFIKAVIHVLIFVALIFLASHYGPFGLLIAFLCSTWSSMLTRRRRRFSRACLCQIRLGWRGCLVRE